jgi:glycosyltransferase involved in cell wall biosynthesis
VQALFRRLGTFVSALGAMADHVEMLHFVPPAHPARSMDPGRLREEQSQRWGTPVTVTLAATEPVKDSVLSYAAGLIRYHRHPAYSPFAGPRQTAAFDACLERDPDLLFVHRLMGMGPLLHSRRPRPPTLFDLDDVEHWVKIRGALERRSPIGTSVRLAQAPAIMAAERRAIGQAARTFVCSDHDRDYLRRLRLPGIITIPNAVAIPPAAQPVAAEKTVMLLGAYHYRPNFTAAERLITKIWPIIHAAVPSAKLIIAGGTPEFIPSFRSSAPGIEFTGIVDDLASLYRRTRIVCCPLGNGGGTRLKLIEAAAFARPIVSTAVGAEGLALRDDRDIVIREDDRSIATACIRLLEDDDACARLGHAAYRVARASYDREAIKKLIMTEAANVLAAPRIPKT